MKMHTLRFDGSEYFLNGELLTPEKSQKLINHSPDGFNHGYGGSGPAQLALAIMLELTGKSDGYQQFKHKIISKLPIDRDFDISFAL